MTKLRSHWDDVRRIADELEPRIHLAEAGARERWSALQPRLVEIERMIPLSSEHIRTVLSRKLATVGATLRRLRDDLEYAHA